LKKIPVLIRSIPRARQLEVSLVENLHREDLNPLEIAFVFRRMMEELGYTHEDIAERVGKDRTSVTNYLRLLLLPKSIQDYLAENKISMGQARALVPLENEEVQAEVAKQIIQKNMTVREVERLISRLKKAPAKAKKELFDPNLKAVEEELIRLLGTKVAISGSQKRGTIKIFYFSLDDLNRLYEKIKGEAR
jgi:ParB family chromosome partitioning protein